MPILTVDGFYDVDVVGSYSLEVSLIDSSLNEVNQSVVLNVVQSIEQGITVEPTSIYLEDIINKHKINDTSIGIDVSKWQGDIDWDVVKASGVEFAMLRIGYQGSESKETTLDLTFWYNYENAKRVGIDVGVYYYSLSNSVHTSIKQAFEIIDLLDGVSLDLPIVFDWEEWNYLSEYNLSIQELNTMVDAFIHVVEMYGYTGMNYSSKNYMGDLFYNDDPLWLAHYVDETNYEGDYAMWQLTCFGRVDGIEGYVDLNVLYD